MLTQENVKRMNEAQLRREVLVPLLQAMGYHDVYEYHGGTGEQGKDIVCWKNDDLGSRENLAIVAKATQMTGKAQSSRGTAGEVQTQIRQCFGSTFVDPVSGADQIVHRVWVVSNKKISKETIDAITASVADQTGMRNVRFIDGNRLWDLVKEHLPPTLLQSIEEVRRQLSVLDTHYEPRITIESGQTSIELVEKFPGAAEENPIVIKGPFRFPTNEDVKAFQSSYKRLVETGEPVNVSGEFIADIDSPEVIQSLLGVNTLQMTSLQILPTEVPTKIPVQLEFLCDDGDQFTLSHVVLRWERGGTKEVTFIDDEPFTPFDVRFVLQIASQTSYLDIRLRDIPFNAVQLLEILQLQTCLSKNVRIRVVNIEDGITFFEVQKQAGSVKLPDARYVSLIEQLATIQRKAKRRLVIPDREMTIDELQIIEELYGAVTHGHFEEKWQNFSVTMDLTQDNYLGLTDVFGEGKEGQLGLEFEETVRLFDVEIPLGRVRQIVKGAKLQNIGEVRAQLLAMPSINASIRLLFTPGNDASFIKQYLDWLH